MSLSYKRLEGQQIVVYNASGMRLMMCGLSQRGDGCSQDKDGVITLRYEDGSTESAPCPDIELAEAENLFSVVGTVQRRARGEEKCGACCLCLGHRKTTEGECFEEGGGTWTHCAYYYDEVRAALKAVEEAER